jgi:hypothetical protein
MDPQSLSEQWQKAVEHYQQMDALEVLSEPRQQAGQEILVAACPRCHTVAALSGEGRHLCRTCGQLLRYRKK